MQVFEEKHQYNQEINGKSVERGIWSSRGKSLMTKVKFNGKGLRAV